MCRLSQQLDLHIRQAGKLYYSFMILILLLAFLIGINVAGGGSCCSFNRQGRENSNLCEIPDILVGDNPIITTVQQNHPSFIFYDSNMTRRCLTGKNLLFLGDSTMEETMDDLNILFVRNWITEC